MQSNAQVRQGTRTLDRIGRRRTSDHEARGAEYAATVGFFDGGVDRLAKPEIVRRDDQAI